MNPAGMPLEFDPYGNAKPDLVTELGKFCSFCEKSLTRSAFHVEHILAKGCLIPGSQTLKYPHLKKRWDNFLLACVNCNSVKGDKDVAVLAPFMPHENNLLHFLEIQTGGMIVMKTGVVGNDRIRTQAFIDLVGLDRIPGHAQFSMKDDRWDERLEAYDLAGRYLAKYTSNPPTADIESIVDLAMAIGFYTIWYQFFIGHDPVINAFINGFTRSDGSIVEPFPSTCNNSFDATNHYNTLPRP